MDYTSLISPAIAARLPFTENRPLEVIAAESKLPSLLRMYEPESPYGACRKVKEILTSFAEDQDQGINRRSDSSGYKLRRALKKYKSYDTERITPGGDTADLLKLILSVFLKADEEVIIPSFSSESINICVSGAGGKIISAPCADDWSASFESILRLCAEKRPRMIVFANPTVPVGGFAVFSRISSFLEYLNAPEVLVVISEDLVEYLGQGYRDLYELIDSYPNLILLRSFSYAYGLAAVKAGYALSCKQIAGILSAAQIPSGISHLAEECAVAALSDREFLLRVVNSAAAERNRFFDFCRYFGIPVADTQSNSVTVNIPGRASHVCHELQRYGIFVRSLEYLGMKDTINIVLGNNSQNNRLFECLQEILLIPYSMRDKDLMFNKEYSGSGEHSPED